MDIAALSINLSQVQLWQAVGTATLKIALDTGRENADMLTGALAASIQMLESPFNPYLEARLDVTV
jgi:hypothetical protein